MSTEHRQTPDEIRRERAALRAEYGELYDWLARALYEDDPIGINFGQGADEYEPEVGTILPRLAACSNAADVQAVMHEEFCRWFDPQLAGPLERYAAVATSLWERLRRSQAT